MPTKKPLTSESLTTEAHELPVGSHWVCERVEDTIILTIILIVNRQCNAMPMVKENKCLYLILLCK